MAERELSTAAAPVVSIILPTFDREPLLREAVASVLAQTFADWELIVVDDGSTDGTRPFLETLDDPRVRPVFLAHAGSPPRARSAGVARARGEWVAFLDSDDLWLPRKLELQLGQLGEHPDCGWSCTGYQLIDAERRPIPRRPPVEYRPQSGWVLSKLLAFGVDAAIQTLVVRRSLVSEVGGFDERLTLRDDYDLVLRLAARSPMWAAPETLSLIRDHPTRTTSLTRQVELFRQNALVFAKAAGTAPDHAARALCRRQRAEQLVAMAGALAREGDRLGAIRAVVQGVAAAPLEPRLWRAAAGWVARRAGAS